MRQKHLLTAQIFEYVFAFIHMLICAIFFSVRENIYILFLIFSILSLVLGLYTETIKYHLNKGDKKDYKIHLIVITCLSIISCPACIFNLLALLDNKEEKTIKVVNTNYKEEKNTKKQLFKPCVWVAIVSLALIIVTSIIGNVFETSGGSVVVVDKYITSEETSIYNEGRENALNGTSYNITDPKVKIAYTMYKPKQASPTNPYPVVFVVPGFTRTKATMTQYAIELSRRGAVVFVIDPGSQGNTTYGGYLVDENGEYIVDSNGDKSQNSYSVARSGMGYLMQYVYNDVDDFDFIDRDRIGLVGHSAGGGDSAKLANDFGGKSYEESIVKALYVSGYIKASAIKVFSSLHCNSAMSYAKYDEGAFRYQTKDESYEAAALEFISKVNPNPGTFIQDYDYGQIEDGTYRIIHHEEINHCFEMYDKISIANTIEFFRRTLSMNTTISDVSQVWFVREVCNGISLVSAFALIISLVSIIIFYVPFMKPLQDEAKAHLEDEQRIRETYTTNLYERSVAKVEQKERTLLKRLLFWLPMVLTAIIACLDYIPLARLSMDLFPDAAGNVYTFYYPARMMNAVFLWAVVNGSIGLVIWALTTVLENLYYTIESKVKNVPNRSDWSKFKGLKVNPINLLKSLGLAVLLFFVFYGVLGLVYLVTHQDFRFMLISASPLNKRFLVTWLIYLAGFFVFYISNSIRVNLTIAREGFKEWQVLLIGALANSLGLVFIIIINYFPYFTTGTVYYGYYSPTDLSEMWLYINMVFGLIVMMFILPIFNRLVYKKTGNVYSGALLWCMIFIMMSLSASISFIPM